MLRAFIFCALFLLAPLAWAQPPGGAGDPKFAQAKSAWLAGDDHALEALRELSDAENDAATLLLGRLLQMQYFDGQDTAQADGGHEPLFQRIADRSPLAKAFLKEWASPMSDAEAAELAAAFFRLGEPLAGYQTISNRGVHGFYGRFAKFPPDVLALAIDPEIELTLRATIFMTIGGLYPTPLHQKTVADQCAEQSRTGVFAPFGAWCGVRGTERQSPVALTAFTGAEDIDPPTARIVSAWLMAYAPAYARVCNSACPEAPDDCAFRVYQVSSALFGYASLRSPLETLIPQAEFRASERAALDLWARLLGHADRTVTYDGALEKDKRLNACLREALTAKTPPWTTKD